MDAQDIVLSLAAPGLTLGHDTVPEGKVALVIGAGSDTIVIEGTPQQLRERVVDGLSLPVPDGVPLFDAVVR